MPLKSQIAVFPLESFYLFFAHAISLLICFLFFTHFLDSLVLIQN